MQVAAAECRPVASVGEAGALPGPGEDSSARLVELARGQAPLRRTLAALAGRLVATRAWERLGYARLRDYAVERAGISGRELQDLARVDRALAELPGVESAFLAGVLSWTKARLVARVATREDEARWVAFAEPRTARELACEVRAVDRRSLENGGATVSGDNDCERRVGVILRCEPGVRIWWHRARWLARRVAGEHLSTGECMEAITAEVLSAMPSACESGGGALEAGADDEAPRSSGHLESDPSGATLLDADGSSPQASGSEGEPANACAAHALRAAIGRDDPSRPDPDSKEDATIVQTIREERLAALPVFLRKLAAELEHADPFELDERLRRALRLEQHFEAAVGPLLVEVARGRLYRAVDLPNLDAFVRELLDMAPRKAQALLRLERACDVCPELRAAYRSGRLSWVRAHALVPVLLLEHAFPFRGAWVEHAEGVSVRQLVEDVDRALASDRLDPVACCDASDPQTGARPTASSERARIFFNAPREVATLFRAALASIQRRIERSSGRPSDESEAFGAILGHVLVAWGNLSEGRIRKEHRVFERDGWRCAVPGCTSYRNLHRHHIEFRSAGGSDDDSNCITLCAFHHLRGVHAGLLRIRGQAPGGLRFEVGLRAGHAPLAIYTSGDRLVREGPPAQHLSRPRAPAGIVARPAD